jgi:apolipoprotein N-acyltransferase
MKAATSVLARQNRTGNRSALSQPVPEPARKPQLVLLLLLCVAALGSSVLLYLCYFPVAWGFLGWVALVPLLLLVRARMAGALRYGTALIAGLGFYWLTLLWMPVADPRMYFGWFSLGVYCAIFFPLGLFLIRFVDQKTRLPLVVTVPVVWTALEFFRATFCGGFGWYLLAHCQHDYLPVIQIADITGAYGVSFLVAAVNAFVVEILFSFVPTPRYNRLALLCQGAAVATAILATLGYGVWQLRHDNLGEGPRIALIQGNLDQSTRNSTATADGQTVQFHYESLSMLAGSNEHHPDLIAWPETSYPWAWKIDVDGQPDKTNLKDAKVFTDESRTNLLLGLNAIEEQPDTRYWRYNSAILLTAEGQPAGRYDKIHRVPFGEYVPLNDWVPLMNRFSLYDYDYSIHPGRSHTRFPLTQRGGDHRPFTFGVLICYEDTDPDVARPYGGGDGERPADFVLNISNDGWFAGTSEHEQHLAICRFRAVECRRSVLRAVNMGVSAVVDADGRVLQPRLLYVAKPPPEVQMAEADPPRVWDVSPNAGPLPVSKWHEYKKVQGILLATVPLDRRSSFYAMWGDWLCWLCWLLLTPVLAVIVWRVTTQVGMFVARSVGVAPKPPPGAVAG